MNQKEIEELGVRIKKANDERSSLIENMKILQEQRDTLSSQIDLIAALVMAEARKIDTLEEVYLTAVEQEKACQVAKPL